MMTFNEEGEVEPSHCAYDKKVAAVISGAGGYKPGIILGKSNTNGVDMTDGTQKSSTNRVPIALVGKVYCKVDASTSPIEIGDLLTTSPTPGHAMKAEDPLKAFGAVIGKALSSIKNGLGLIPVLVALQ